MIAKYVTITSFSPRLTIPETGHQYLTSMDIFCLSLTFLKYFTLKFSGFDLDFLPLDVT